MHLGTRTVAAIAALRCLEPVRLHEVSRLCSSDVRRQPSDHWAMRPALVSGAGSACRLKFGAAREQGSRRRSVLQPKDRDVSLPRRGNQRLHLFSGVAEVARVRASVAAPGETRRIRINLRNWLPRMSPGMGPWLGSSTRIRYRESARSPPGDRGNRATRLARLPSGRSHLVEAREREFDMSYRSPPRPGRQGRRRDPGGLALVALVPLAGCSAMADSLMAADPVSSFVLLLIAVAALCIVLAALASLAARAAEGLIRLAARLFALATLLATAAVLMGALLTAGAWAATR